MMNNLKSKKLLLIIFTSILFFPLVSYSYDGPWGSEKVELLGQDAQGNTFIKREIRLEEAEGKKIITVNYYLVYAPNYYTPVHCSFIEDSSNLPVEIYCDKCTKGNVEYLLKTEKEEGVFYSPLPRKTLPITEEFKSRLKKLSKPNLLKKIKNNKCSILVEVEFVGLSAAGQHVQASYHLVLEKLKDLKLLLGRTDQPGGCDEPQVDYYWFPKTKTIVIIEKRQMWLDGPGCKWEQETYLIKNLQEFEEVIDQLGYSQKFKDPFACF